MTPLPVAATGPPVSVLVSGSREWRARGPIHADLRTIEATGRMFVIIEGAAKGADRLAGLKYAAGARYRGIGWVSLPAQWSVHEGCRCRPDSDYCSYAGFRRNQQMLEYLLACRELGHTCIVLAYPKTGERNRGTNDMATRAMKAEFRVFNRNPQVYLGPRAANGQMFPTSPAHAQTLPLQSGG